MQKNQSNSNFSIPFFFFLLLFNYEHDVYRVEHNSENKWTCKGHTVSKSSKTNFGISYWLLAAISSDIKAELGKYISQNLPVSK